MDTVTSITRMDDFLELDNEDGMPTFFRRKPGSYVDTEEMMSVKVEMIPQINWETTNPGVDYQNVPDYSVAADPQLALDHLVAADLQQVLDNQPGSDSLVTTDPKLVLDHQPSSDYLVAADPKLGIDYQPGPDYLVTTEPKLDPHGLAVANPDLGQIFVSAQDCQEEAGISMDFWVQKCPKDRAVPYLVGKDGSLTTRNQVPVTFCCSGIKPGHCIIVAMRYSDTPNQNIPVNSCKQHNDCTVCEKNQRMHPPKYNFCMVQPERNGCQYILIDGHPAAMLTNLDACKDSQGIVTFQVIISCLNSCIPHRDSGKKMELQFQISERTTMTELFKKCINVRACKNVKRDHKDDDDEIKIKNEQRIKRPKTENLLDEKSPVVKTESLEPRYFFQMRTHKHTQIIVDLIKELGGTPFNMDDLQ